MAITFFGKKWTPSADGKRQDFAMVCHALAGILFENPPDAVESLKAEMKTPGRGVLIAA